MASAPTIQPGTPPPQLSSLDDFYVPAYRVVLNGKIQPQLVLQQILKTLQPYNCKLNQILTAIDNGTATKAEQQFYHKLITVFFCVQEPGIVNQYENDRKKFDKNIDVYSKVLCQDLNEFKLPCLTPH